MSVEILTTYYTENYKDLSNMLRRRKLAHSGDEEDILQSAYTKALQFIDSFNPNKKIDVWFFTILNNCYRDYYRQESLSGAAYEELVEEEHPIVDQSLLVDQEAIRKVGAYIYSKYEPMRTILHLYFIKQYAPRDIVYLVDKWNYNSIRALVSTCNKELKEILKY